MKNYHNTKKSEKREKAFDRSSVIAELFRSFPDKKYAIKALAAASGGADSTGREDTRRIVRGLMSEGIVEEAGEGKFRLRDTRRKEYEGVVDMLPSGSMYVAVEGLEKDIFVHQRNAGRTLHGDRVRVSILRRRGNGAAEGEITEIIERNPRNYVGVVDISRGFIFIKVDSRKVPTDIFVAPDPKLDLHNGQKVLVRVVEWDERSRNPRGEVVEIFGDAGDNNAEMHAILAEYDLPYRFDSRVEEAAEAISDDITAEIARRRDFRDTVTFTIDPADAKDFDDALSVRRLENGNYQVGIHIADVTHYVTEGSVVDTEAVDRATSVYLVDRTVPMLPERLSNGLCSLRPDEEKLCFSAVFEIDAEGAIHDQWFGRTAIRSDRRFTYADAQAVIETGEGDFRDEILALHTLAQKLRVQRFEHGAIAFEREEAKFELDANGKPLGVFFKEQKESNQLIEEFMLLANRKVAEFVGKMHAGEKARTFVYRVHDKPNEDKLTRFTTFIGRFGYRFTAVKGRAISREMNRLMGEIHGKNEENLISTLAIRTMAKAFYTTDNIGHYGLAFDYYTHFTSPIRRYPDMIVHRLLARYLADGASAHRGELEELCKHSSDMEVRASEAERASIKYKMVEFMTDRVGQEFDGHVSGVTEWGLYVELNDTHIEGMVSLRDIPGDFYEYIEQGYAIRGRSTGRSLTLGDEVRIRVKRADLARKQLDFEIRGSYDFETRDLTPIHTGDPAPKFWMTHNSRRRR